ncbi:hypothetical protein [Enterococcus cecorum]|uniref:hypothetical protein n=1 Tax=Enterococcus cecorum TaxID=44008 RepID=UPI001FAC11EB|nr:hypothetical protein [Enterococcus cecorum]MCJ0565104.1 hypothetical protein [Enterococcus cecorum]CAI3428082.1 hypothetical protein CIRMBP1277_01712 [Enterococcus cecorum]
MNAEIMNKINEYGETNYADLIQAIIKMERPELSLEEITELYQQYMNNDEMKLLGEEFYII